MEVHVSERPYLHFLVARLFLQEEAVALLGLLEAAAWMRNEGNFYNFDILAYRGDYEEISAFAMRVSERAGLSSILTQKLHLPASECYAVEIHRYREGSGIGAHTDDGSGNARAIISLNRDWRILEGGIWLLARDGKLSQDRRHIAPLNNTGIAFATGSNTYHALSVRNSSESYALTLCYRSSE